MTLRPKPDMLSSSPTTPINAKPPAAYAAPRLASIDLGTHAAKIVVGHANTGQPRVEVATRLVFPSQANEADWNVRLAMLSDYFSQWSGVRIATAACCLPGALSDYETASLPIMGANAHDAGRELIEQLNGNPDEMAWDAWISTTESTADNRDLIHLVWADLNQVNETHSRLAEAGLCCETIDAKPAALAPLANDAERATLVVDLGRDHAEIVAVEAGRVVYARRRVAIATDNLVASIAAELGVEHASAEMALAEFPIGGAASFGGARVRTLVDDWLNTLQFELERTTAFLKSRVRVELPPSLVLCGGGAALLNIAQRVQQATGLATSVADPPPGVVWSAAEAFSPTYAVATALFAREADQ